MTLIFKYVLVEYQRLEVKVRLDMIFYLFDLTLGPITLILNFHLGMVKTYLCTQNEIHSFSGSKGETRTDRQIRLKLLPIRIGGW